MTFSTMKTPTSSFHRLWNKFAGSKTFRGEYVVGYVKRSIPAQIRALMKKRGLTQQQLADQAGLTQGVISRAADLDYGDLTLNTIVRIAAGFDCAFVGKYVPFSEFLKELDKQSDPFVPSFETENDYIKQAKQENDILRALRKGLGAAPGKKLEENRLQQEKKKDAA